MSVLMAAGLIGCGTAGLVHSLLGVRSTAGPAGGRPESAGPAGWVGRLVRIGPLGRRRRAHLVRATGPVSATDLELTALAGRQWQAVLVAATLAAAVVVPAPSAVRMVAASAMLAVGWQGPLVVARRSERARRASVDLELVDTLGEMVMGVEAGLTLEAVMLRYASAHSTALADEFRHVLDLVQLGWHRGDALAEMAQRNPSPIVGMFSAAVVQNQRLGTPLAAVLRQQAATARRKRRQAVEEAAAKVPLKMIFPTVFCVLPVMMIVVVGPAVINLIQALP